MGIMENGAIEENKDKKYKGLSVELMQFNTYMR